MRGYPERWGRAAPCRTRTHRCPPTGAPTRRPDLVAGPRLIPAPELASHSPVARAGTLWRHRDFRLLWAGETVSELGSQVSLVAIPLVAVRTLHASAFQVGVLTSLSTAAFLLVGLPAGAWVDRLSRRRVMIGADVGRLAALGSVPIAYEVGHLGLPQLYAVAFVAGVLTVFFDVAYQSYLPFLVGVDRLVEGNAKLAGSAQVAQVAGPSLAGGLVQAVGGALAVAIDAGSYAVSAVGVGAARAREPSPERTGRVGLRREVGQGL
ncbi:MAG TPA: MFS transporter, partial [Acidimicrobiales bacterium]|nr:MFS transporter [Acidimicrobiales bacterium]